MKSLHLRILALTFWPELVENRAEWRTTARYCPGIGQGPLIQITAAVEAADEMRKAYPGIYDPS